MVIDWLDFRRKNVTIITRYENYTRLKLDFLWKFLITLNNLIGFHEQNNNEKWGSYGKKDISMTTTIKLYSNTTKEADN